MDGVRATIRRGWTRLFGRKDWYVFLRHHNPPSTPLELPVEMQGVTVRHMTANDIDEVAQLMPFDLDRRPQAERRERMLARLREAFVATRQHRIIGAAWYTDHVTPEQPWYRAVETHLLPPARLTANIFVVPGEKGAAWILSKNASEQLASSGVRTIVGLIDADNKPSMLMSRMLGGKMVGRQSVRYWFGHQTIVVEPILDERAFGPSDRP